MRMALRWSAALVSLISAAGIVLTAASPAVAADAPGDWFDASGPLTPGAQTPGSISPANDDDWYYFYNDVPAAVSSGAVRIGIDRPGGVGDSSTLLLYRWDGGKLVHVDSVATFDDPINTAMAAGLYYVHVRDAYDDGDTTDYTFSVAGDYVRTSPAAGSKVQRHPSAVRIAEDNRNEWWQAVGPLESARPYVGAIETGGDDDWFYFYNDVPSSVSAGTVRLGINRRTGDTDATTLILYRWDGGKMVEVDSLITSDGEPINSALKAGLYYVYVRDGYDDGDTPRYDFTVAGDYVKTALTETSKVQRHPGAAIAVTEDNRNEWWQASGPIEPAKPYAGAIETGGDDDWFYFFNDVPSSVTAGTVRMGINEQMAGGEACTLLLFRWENGKLVEVDSMMTSDSSAFNSALKGGLYYIHVRDGYDDGGTGTYDFSVAGDYVSVRRPFVSSVAGNSSTLRRGATYTFSGSVQPVAGVTLQVYRYDAMRRKYVAQTSSTATVASSGSPRRFTARWRPTSAGKYRLRWVTSAAGMGAGTSGYRIVTVR